MSQLTMPSHAHPPPIEARPIHAAAMLVAFGDLAGAADRRSARDLLDAWRRVVLAAGRRDLLERPTLYHADAAVLLSPRDPRPWALLVDAALACARFINTDEAEAHWQLAATYYRQLAANMAAALGAHVAGALRDWQRAAWQDGVDDGVPVTEACDELLGQTAAAAAHYARFIVGEAPGRSFRDPDAAHAAGLVALEQHLSERLKEADLIREHAHADGPSVDVCELCQGCDGAHDRACPLAQLAAPQLLAVYFAAVARVEARSARS